MPPATSENTSRNSPPPLPVSRHVARARLPRAPHTSRRAYRAPRSARTMRGVVDEHTVLDQGGGVEQASSSEADVQPAAICDAHTRQQFAGYDHGIAGPCLRLHGLRTFPCDVVFEVAVRERRTRAGGVVADEDVGAGAIACPREHISKEAVTSTATTARWSVMPRLVKGASPSRQLSVKIDDTKFTCVSVPST